MLTDDRWVRTGVFQNVLENHSLRLRFHPNPNVFYNQNLRVPWCEGMFLKPPQKVSIYSIIRTCRLVEQVSQNQTTVHRTATQVLSFQESEQIIITTERTKKFWNQRRGLTPENVLDLKQLDFRVEMCCCGIIYVQMFETLQAHETWVRQHGCLC